MNRLSRLIVSVGCISTALLLTGCEPTEGTVSGGSSGCDPHGIAAFQPAHCQGSTRKVDTASRDTSSGKPECDPHGFGPLSGCGSNNNDDSSGNSDSYTSSGGPLPKSFYYRARHEAGHKRCAEEFGMNVTSVWLHANGEGRTNISGFRFKDPQQRLVVLYCGEVAAGTDEGTEGESSNGSPGDHEQENNIIDAYQVDSGTARADAERIVSERSSQIDSDANRLLAKGEL